MDADELECYKVGLRVIYSYRDSYVVHREWTCKGFLRQCPVYSHENKSLSRSIARNMASQPQRKRKHFTAVFTNRPPSIYLSRILINSDNFPKWPPPDGVTRHETSFLIILSWIKFSDRKYFVFSNSGNKMQKRSKLIFINIYFTYFKN